MTKEVAPPDQPASTPNKSAPQVKLYMQAELDKVFKEFPSITEACRQVSGAA